MLVNDLKYHEVTSNYHNKYSGMDTPGKSVSSLKDFQKYPIQEFDYRYNSWGFRGPEYEQYIGKPVNICLGDSFTVNVGGPIEHSWASQLARRFDIPTLNLGMDGAGNDAIRLVYDRACKIFDVQNTFVMYSYLHRRLIDNDFRQHVHTNNENFKYFLEHRISNVFECGLPGWNWSNEEKKFLSKLEIYFLDVLYFSDDLTVDRKFVLENVYNNLRGPDWPTFKQFVEGAEPHPEMITAEFGQFMSDDMCKNRDGHHMNQKTNKLYADYLYNQWKQRNKLETSPLAN